MCILGNVNGSNAHSRAGDPNKCVTNNKEYTMKKQGFTLIELMVVIVIMGILAAVAVPKLFGMIAKSKASEVPTAAGTYINLQDAYASESNKLGSWQAIGYSGPGTKKTTTGSQVYESGNFWYAEGQMGTADWSASPRTKLNDCSAEATQPTAAATTHSWYLVSTFNNSTGGDGEGNITLKASGIDACTSLTPAFANLIKGRETAGN